MGKLSRQELEKRLFDLRRASTFVGLTCKTVPTMRKTNNPFFGAIHKHTELTGLIGTYRTGSMYVRSINNRRRRTADANESTVQKFYGQSLSWGHRLRGTPLILHTNAQTNLYLSVICIPEVHTYKQHFVSNATGDTIDDIEVAPFLRERDPAEIQIRMFNLDSIRGIRIDGEAFDVQQPATLALAENSQ